MRRSLSQGQTRPASRKRGEPDRFCRLSTVASPITHFRNRFMNRVGAPSIRAARKPVGPDFVERAAGLAWQIRATTRLISDSRNGKTDSCHGLSMGYGRGRLALRSLGSLACAAGSWPGRRSWPGKERHWQQRVAWANAKCYGNRRTSKDLSFAIEPSRHITVGLAIHGQTNG